jgi:hypothetical protein
VSVIASDRKHSTFERRTIFERFRLLVITTSPSSSDSGSLAFVLRTFFLFVVAEEAGLTVAVLKAALSPVAVICGKQICGHQKQKKNAQTKKSQIDHSRHESKVARARYDEPAFCSPLAQTQVAADCKQSMQK